MRRLVRLEFVAVQVAVIFVVYWTSTVDRVRAEELERKERTGAVAAIREGMDEGLLLPFTLSARVGAGTALVSTSGGYDGAAGSPLMNATAEARVWGPVALRAGADYSNGANRMRPTFGVRVQLLRQERHGVDGTIATFYRAEGFTELEGEIETVLSLARRWNRFLVLGNLIYGQDPEGRERDAEMRLALVYRYGHGVLGFDSRARFAIQATSVPTAGSRLEPQFDALAGPVASVTWGSWAIFGEIGPSALRVTDQTRYGAAGLTGLSAAF